MSGRDSLTNKRAKWFIANLNSLKRTKTDVIFQRQGAVMFYMKELHTGVEKFF